METAKQGEKNENMNKIDKIGYIENVCARACLHHKTHFTNLSETLAASVDCSAPTENTSQPSPYEDVQLTG